MSLAVQMHQVEDLDIAGIIQVTAMPAGTIKRHLYPASRYSRLNCCAVRPPENCCEPCP